MMAVRYEIKCDGKFSYSEISLVGACTRAKLSSNGMPGVTVTVVRTEAGKPDVLEARYRSGSVKPEAWVR